MATGSESHLKVLHRFSKFMSSVGSIKLSDAFMTRARVEGSQDEGILQSLAIAAEQVQPIITEMA
jgi:hypothetical protein